MLPTEYLRPICDVLRLQWPQNRAVTIVCHGHSVPAGYFATPVVDTFNAYPHLLHLALKERFPFGLINVIVTAIGGETSQTGAERFRSEVLNHRPDVVTIDYALNDRGIGLQAARRAWSSMIEAAQESGVRVMLLTPTGDTTQLPGAPAADRQVLQDHARQIRDLANEHDVALVDSLAAWEGYVERGGELGDLLSLANHPNHSGHEVVARELMRWFLAW